MISIVFVIIILTVSDSLEAFTSFHSLSIILGNQDESHCSTSFLIYFAHCVLIEPQVKSGLK